MTSLCHLTESQIVKCYSFAFNANHFSWWKRKLSQQNIQIVDSDSTSARLSHYSTNSHGQRIASHFSNHVFSRLDAGLILPWHGNEAAKKFGILSMTTTYFNVF